MIFVRGTHDGGSSCAVLKARRRGWSRPLSVVIARGLHLFPFRTEQLSLSAPMVLGSQGPGRVGRRRFFSAERDARAAHPGRRGSRLLTRGAAVSARGTRTPVRGVPPRRGAGADRRAMRGGGDARLPAPSRAVPRLHPRRAAARSRGRRRRARGRTARSGGVGGRRGTCVRRLGAGSDGTCQGHFAGASRTGKPCK